MNEFSPLKMDLAGVNKALNDHPKRAKTSKHIAADQTAAMRYLSMALDRKIVEIVVRPGSANTIEIFVTE